MISACVQAGKGGVQVFLTDTVDYEGEREVFKPYKYDHKQKQE